MDAPPPFLPGEPVVDAQDVRYGGRVDDVRADGGVRVIWKSGRHEWCDPATIRHAPGFKRKRRHKPI